MGAITLNCCFILKVFMETKVFIKTTKTDVLATATKKTLTRDCSYSLDLNTFHIYF